MSLVYAYNCTRNSQFALFTFTSPVSSLYTFFILVFFFLNCAIILQSECAMLALIRLLFVSFGSLACTLCCGCRKRWAAFAALRTYKHNINVSSNTWELLFVCFLFIVCLCLALFFLSAFRFSLKFRWIPIWKPLYNELYAVLCCVVCLAYSFRSCVAQLSMWLRFVWI